MFKNNQESIVAQRSNTNTMEKGKKEFEEFGAFNQIASQQRKSSENLFKSENIIQGSQKKIEIVPDENDEPVIIVRRTEGIVESVEFSCKCGRNSIIDLKYE